MKKLVISIVTWNSGGTIRQCIESILTQATSFEYELIIVDNNSFDDTKKIVKTFQDSRIRLVELAKNTGFCGGHNYAIKDTNSDLVLLVNPDIQLTNNYIQLAVEAIESDKRIGTVCGLLLQNDPGDIYCLIDSAGLEKKRSGLMKMRFHGAKLIGTDLKASFVFGSDGALPLYKREMIEDISIDGNFFDEMFFAHKEDWDVSWRANLFGWKTLFLPHCVAIHPRYFKPGSLSLRKDIESSVKIHAVKNQLILLLKNQRISSLFIDLFFILPRQLAVLVFILVNETTSLAAYSFVFKNFSDILKSRKKIQNRIIR